MSIPLVQNNEKDSINTSIIAIKRNIERINMLLGLVDSGSPDLSGLATKQELEDAITQVETDLAPVDEVTLGNMQSVTSNAVAVAFGGEWETLWTGANTSFVKAITTKLGKLLRVRFNGAFSGVMSNGQTLFTITNTEYRPVLNVCRFVLTIDTTSNTRMNASIDYYHDGRMCIYFQDRASFSETVGVAGLYCDALVLVL